MPALHELQNQFLDSVFDEDESILDYIAQNDALSTAQQMQIYRNNATLILTDMLKNTFPAVCRLVSDAFFNFAANSFLKQHPPTGGDLNAYGHQFPEFLDQFEPLSAHPYMGDIARIEYARHAAYLADDQLAISIEELQQIDDNDLAETLFKLQPSVTLISSGWPIDKIWHMAQSEEDEPTENVDIGQKDSYLMIVRTSDLDVEVWTLEYPLYLFLSAIAEGKTFGLALETALHENESFEIHTHIGQLLAGGVFQGFKNN